MTTRKKMPSPTKTIRTLREQMTQPPLVPIGTRVRLTALTKDDQQYVPLEKGDEGEVVGGNEACLWVRFDRGYDINVIPGIDKYEVVDEQKEAS